MIIEKGDAKPYMMTQQDLEFLASRKFSRDEIFGMFQVSPAVVGVIENANRSIMDGLSTRTRSTTWPLASRIGLSL
jgi:capsid portal protein